MNEGLPASRFADAPKWLLTVAVRRSASAPQKLSSLGCRIFDGNLDPLRRKRLWSTIQKKGSQRLP